MERYTRKHAESAFLRLVPLLGPAPPGQHWALDSAPAYGGYVVELIRDQGGGVHQPFGPMRRSAREFCEVVRFAEDVARVQRQEV